MQKCRLVGFGVVVLLAASSCVTAQLSIPVEGRKTVVMRKGAIVLVLPVRDCVQAGKPHPAGAGTGEKLQKAIESGLASKTSFQVKSVPEGDGLTHGTVISPEAAIAYGLAHQADYVLTATLGEFRDAAPMTFRTDFVTLDSAALYDVQSGKAAWELVAPARSEGPNVGDALSMVEGLGASISDSIARGEPKGICPPTQRPEWASASAKEKKTMTDECHVGP